MVASDFLAMTEVLSEAGGLGEPAELHGQLCGLACILGDQAGPPWIADTLGHMQSGAPREAAENALAAVASATLTALDTGDMSLQLLLPDDEAPIDDRASQLGLWCRGFLHGLVQGAPPPAVLETGATGEIVSDFGEISHASLGADESLAEAESAYTELVEFVRVSVQLMFEELHAQRGSGRGAAH